MSSEVLDPSSFSADIQDFLRVLCFHDVRFMIVGGEAVIFYGHIRLTGDIDVYYDRDHKNATQLFKALSVFWKGVVPGLGGSSDLEIRGTIFQFGVPPNRIDLINQIDGVDFKSAWNRRTEVKAGRGSESITFSYIGLDELIKNKRASGRPKDLDDLPFLIEARDRKPDNG
ncbi:MAG: hypothetical protein GY906_04210 [bacterium]|nr:hypothetical protein [bacterium]